MANRTRQPTCFTARQKKEKEHKHNSESETNSPYIVVGTYESECRPNNPEGADLPDTPSLACAYVQGLLDGNLGQIVSFQSTYKSTLRIEVPVWPDVHQAVLSPVQAQPQPSFSGTISPVTTQGINAEVTSMRLSSNGSSQDLQ